MNRIIEDKREDLALLCAQRRVRRLELFGSALRDDFDPQTSDLDFLVEFENLAQGQYADNYFGLLEDLERLFGCPVDLVMTSAIKNPYFLKKIHASRVTLYAA
ncbi:nucleotidyltransferase domain-containing protein [Candidatus Poribacteria bacterium]|nr:nucleotidyltransferase domain-containing protein [Candidatus Poribacteria bacterium]